MKSQNDPDEDFVIWDVLSPHEAAELRSAIDGFRAAVEECARRVEEEDRLESAHRQELERLPTIPDQQRRPSRPF